MPNEFNIKNGNISQGNSTVNGLTTLNGNLSFSGNTAINTAWTSYTPSWTSSGSYPILVDGTLTGFYKQIGKTVFVRVKLTTGTSTVFGTGAWRFSLPVQAKTSSGIQFFCTMYYKDLELFPPTDLWFTGIVNGDYAGDPNFSSIITTSSPSQVVSATSPVTWGASCSIQFEGSYESI